MSSPWQAPVAAALRRALVLVVAMGALVAVLGLAPEIPTPVEATSDRPPAGPVGDVGR